MFHGQIIFAESKCTTTPKQSRHQRVFHNFFVYVHDKDLNQPYKSAYAQAVANIQSNYQHAWEGMDESQRSHYCAEYWNDIDFFSDSELNLFSRGHLFSAFSTFYLGALSPISSESIEELERKAKAKEETKKILGPILILAQALSLAGGLSAGNDAISAGKSGNYSISQMRFAQSRGLLRISTEIGTVAGGSLNMDSPTAPLQQSPQASCQTLDYFDQFDADTDSDVWRKYQRLSTGCDALNEQRQRIMQFCRKLVCVPE